MRNVLELAESGVREGLYRTTVAGPGRSLTDAFASLEDGGAPVRSQRFYTEDSWTTRVGLSPEEGEGYWELTRIRSDLYIILSNFKYKNARVEGVPGDGLLQFNFKVSGDLTYGVRLPGPLRFNRPALHLWRQPEGIDMQEWTAPSAFERMVTICTRPEYLLRHFLSGGAESAPRLQTFLTAPQPKIDYCELPLTAQMLDVTVKLLKNPYQGSLYVRYKESLAQQLLCGAIGLCSSPEPPPREYSDRQLRALKTARTLLTERLSSPPTVQEVARIVGLPQKVLTEAFRSVYGETVGDFSLRCRMQHALTLLRDDGASVDDVSAEAGYAHPTSFASAFLRHFGLRPSDVKRRRALT
jgi:AraC-like DNA-binding protein